MASEEMRKKWGTIFMGDREASVEQLNAMQEHVNRDRIRKGQAEDYMERVRARATDRAREILGEAYTERQKVLDEAKGEAAVAKRMAAQECAKIKAEGEKIRKQAQAELEAAQAEREEARRLRETAHDEGYQEGMNQAGAELHEFRAELGQSLAGLMRAIERQRKNILENWRNELVNLVQAAVHAGTGYVLREEHEDVLRHLVCQSLDLLENRGVISLRVNPRDEEAVSDLFRAARERAPELRQWTVHGDEAVEQGGLVADSGSGSVDLQRGNFREMVDGILNFLAIPEGAEEAADEQKVASLVEQEVAHIASLTPEMDQPPQEESVEPETPEAGAAAEAETQPVKEQDAPQPESDMETPAAKPEGNTGETSLAELEEELFPLEDDEHPEEAAAVAEAAPPKNGEENEEALPANVDAALGAELDAELDKKTLTEGGFL